MLEMQVRGAGELRRAARQLRIEDKDLRRGAAKALERGVRKLRSTIPESARRKLPSGYGPVMAADVQVKTSIKLAAREPTITVTVWAEGRPHRDHRDVEAIDQRGNLRHPFFGQRKEHIWYDQAIPKGFASEPFQDTRDDVVVEIEKDWNAMVARVERG